MNVPSKFNWEKINPRTSISHFFSAQENHLIYLKKWHAENPDLEQKIIFLFHDLCQYHGRFLSLVNEMQKMDPTITFIAMDFVGHGLSSGTRGHFDHFEFIADDISYLMNNEIKKENHQWFVIGHGLGGLAVLDLLNRETGYFENKIDGLILSNFIFELEEKLIFNWFSSSFPKISERLRISKVFLGNNLTNDENEALLFEQDPLIVHRPTWGVVQAIKKQSLKVYRGAYFLNWPILLLQSGEDKFLLSKGIEYFVMGVKKNLLTEKSYSNLKHDLYNEKDKISVYNDILKWIGTHEKNI